MRTLPPLILFLALALMLNACGGGGTSGRTGAPGATTSPVSDDAFKAAAEQAANSTLLTRADFPAGWTSQAQQHSNLDLPVSDACRKFFTTPRHVPGIGDRKAIARIQRGTR